MEPVKYFHKGEILLAGFHVGSDVDKRWDKFGQEEEISKLTNIVDGTGFERRIFTSEGVKIFTGVEVTDKNILPTYELLVIPPAHYMMFEINCNADIDQQFIGIDLWFDENKDKYKRIKWENNTEYIVIWSGRYAEEMICEIWVPLENTTD